MKAILVSVLVLLLSGSAFGDEFDSIYRYPDGRVPREVVEQPEDRDFDGNLGDPAGPAENDSLIDPERFPLFRTHCAPSAVEGNIDRTDRVLKQLAHSPQFNDAKKFRSAVAKISAEPDINRKISQYLAMVGIDASNQSQVAEFLGARRPHSQWLVSLEENAGLTPRQADQVVLKLSEALRGGLR